MSDARLTAAAVSIWIAFVCLLYLPVVGTGFQKDDFAWISWAAEAQGQPLSTFLRDWTGTFYRPLVTLSFVADLSLHGLEPWGYGVTNLLLLAACAAAVAALLRTAGANAPMATAGALVWTLNPHGVNMAVLWISGRTSLLMTLFACLSIVAFLRNRRGSGSLLFLAALLSKEDAIAVPVIVMAARWLLQSSGWRTIAADAGGMAAAAAMYALLRLDSGAITPATAPDFYRLSRSPALLAHNAISYLDRSATGAAILTVLGLLVYGVRPALAAPDRRRLAIAAVWFLAGIALTVQIPVRSSLYALFPSIGAALAAAVVLGAARERAPQRDGRFVLLLAATLVLTVAYAPRNARWVEPARVASAVAARLRDAAPLLPDGGVIVFEDSPDRFANFRDAFATLGPEAVRLFTGKHLDAVVLPPGEQQAVPREVARFRIETGQVLRVGAR